MLVRIPGVAAGKDQRLVGNIDVAPTIAHAVDVALPTAPDGRALQDAWQRERILLEGWDTEGTDAYGPFTAVRTRCQTYVKRSGQRPILWERCATGKEQKVRFDGTQEQWAAWLKDLRSCAGAACRDADGGE
jgi:arylsulfatase A-like enzyme